MPFVAVTFSLVPLLLPRPSRCHDNDSRPLVHASEQLHEEFGGSCRAGGPFSFPQGRGRIATVTFDLIPRRAPGLERLLPVTERVCLHPANDACDDCSSGCSSCSKSAPRGAPAAVFRRSRQFGGTLPLRALRMRLPVGRTMLGSLLLFHQSGEGRVGTPERGSRAGVRRGRCRA